MFLNEIIDMYELTGSILRNMELLETLNIYTKKRYARIKTVSMESEHSKNVLSIFCEDLEDRFKIYSIKMEVKNENTKQLTKILFYTTAMFVLNEEEIARLKEEGKI